MDHYDRQRYIFYSYDKMDVPVEKHRYSKKSRRYVQKKARQKIKKETRDATECT